MNIITKYNHIEVVGRMVDGLTFSHTTHFEDVYTFTVAVERRSGTVDMLPVAVIASTINGILVPGQKLRLTGEIRTYIRRNRENGTAHHIVQLFANKIEPTGEDDNNRVELNGAICKPPIFRTTPFGREICDFMLAVNFDHGKSAYIPCIAWGKFARLVSMLNVGEKVALTGRFQSRQYMKVLEDGCSTEVRTAYEVSVADLCKGGANYVSNGKQ